MLLLAQNMMQQTQHFFRWWGYELGGIMPAWLRQVFYTPRPQLFIRLHNFQVDLFCFEQGVEKNLCHVYLHKEGIQCLNEFLLNHPEWVQATKILLLDAKQLLKTRLTLPLAAQENLAQVVSYELDRYTPFTSAQCYFSTRILGKNPAGNRLLVDLLFIARPRLDCYYQDLQAIGLNVDMIAHASDVNQYHTNTYVQPYNLLPAQYRRQERQDIARLNGLFAVCFLILTSMAIALPFWWQQKVLTDLQQQVALVRQQANAVETIKAETTSLLQVEQAVVELKQQAPVILNIIEQLSQLLPKDTWLRNFEYHDHKFMLQGLSASSSALINILEASPYFQQTALVSPVTRDSQEALDQFQLQTYLENAHGTQ